MYKVPSLSYQYSSYYEFFELNRDESIKNRERIESRDISRFLNKSSNCSLSWPIRMYNMDYSGSIINNRIIYSKRELQDPIAYICYMDNNTDEPKNEELEYLIKQLLNNEYKLTVNTVKSINLYTVIELLIKNEINDFELRARTNFNAAGFNISLVLNNKRNRFNMLERIEFKLANIVNVKMSIMKLVPLINNINDYDNIYREKILNLFGKLGFIHKIDQPIFLNITDINNLQKMASIDADDFIEFYKSKDWTNEFLYFRDMLSSPIAKNYKQINFTKTLNVKGFQIRITDYVTPTSLGLLGKIFKNITFSDSIDLTCAIFHYYDKYNDLLNAISVAKLKSLAAVS